MKLNHLLACLCGTVFMLSSLDANISIASPTAPPKNSGTKKPGRLVRAARAVRKALSLKKSPSAATASYSSVRSRRSSSVTGQSVSTRQTSAGPAKVTNINITITNNINVVNIGGGGNRPSPRSPQPNQVTGGSSVARAQHQAIVNQRMVTRYPVASRPQSQGQVAGRPLRPLPPVQRQRQPANTKPQAIVKTGPGFGFQNGQKVARPGVQENLPQQRPASGQYSYVPLKPSGQTVSQYDSVVMPKRNQYDSVSSAL